MGETPPTSDVGVDQMIDALSLYPAAVKVAIAHSEDRLVDVIGQVHSNQALIRSMKKSAISEIGDGEQGKRWKAEIGGSYKRSYNTQSLLAKLTPKDGTLASTLAFLMQTGVIKIQWNWTPLKKLMRETAVQFKIIKREVADGDPEYDIGEYWESSNPTYKPIEETE
jgi:hypothetical protein